jgi:CBS-domain-containing membrane protein
MHDDKFLTLPVCEENGRALGVVGVMDVISACGGSEGWKSVFQHSMDVGGDDDGSVFSPASVDGSIKSSSTVGSKKRRQMKDEKTVANLRPAKPVISTTNETILAVTQALQRKRASASLIVSSDNRLAGILTDTGEDKATSDRTNSAVLPISARLISTCVSLFFTAQM